MGVEPTRDGDYRPADGFEDREAHRDPSTSRQEGSLAPSQELYPVGRSPRKGWFTNAVTVREGEAPAEPARREAHPPATVTRSRALVNHAPRKWSWHSSCYFIVAEGRVGDPVVWRDP